MPQKTVPGTYSDSLGNSSPASRCNTDNPFSVEAFLAWHEPQNRFKTCIKTLVGECEDSFVLFGLILLVFCGGVNMFHGVLDFPFSWVSLLVLSQIFIFLLLSQFASVPHQFVTFFFKATQKACTHFCLCFFLYIFLPHLPSNFAVSVCHFPQ